MRKTAWALALSLSLGCEMRAQSSSRPGSDVTAQDYRMPALRKVDLVLKDAFGARHRVRAEVADSEASRTRGLMWRTELQEGEGMIFLFPEEAVHSFWMRNTLIPLDMLFIDSRGTVVGIVENAEPRTLTGRSVGKKSQYVLEVPGGYCAKVGLAPGSTVDLRGL